jgi:hypothetical protein
MTTIEEKQTEWAEKAAEIIRLMQYQMSPDGQREKRRRHMKQYNQLKEVRTRKNAHKPRKSKPKYCSIKIRVDEEQYKKLQDESLKKNISMAAYARSRIFA